MKTWTFSLESEGNPYLRLGIHGLAHLLAMADSPTFKDYYPLVRQSDRLTWTVTKNTITLTFEKEDDVLPLAWGMTGDLRHGMAVLPYNCPDVNKPAIYATLRGHSAQSQFQAKQGQARTENEKAPVFDKDGTPKMRAATKTKPARQAYADVPKKSIQVLSFTSGNLIEKPYAPKVLPVGPRQIRHSTGLATVHHPALSSWQNKPMKVTKQQAFICLFAVLNYAWTVCEDGVFGLGLDFDTFDESKAKLQEHLNGTRHLWQVHASAETSAHVLASLLKLDPEREYPVTCTTQDAHFFIVPAEIPLRDKLREAYRAGITQMDTKKFLSCLRLVPVFVRRKNNKGEDTYTTLYDLLHQNMRHGFYWGRGLLQLGFLPPRGDDKHKGLRKSERETLAKIIRILEEPMEKLWRCAMREARSRIARKYKDRGASQKKAWEMADSFILNQNLAHATRPVLLRRALNNILFEGRSTYPLFDTTMMEWFDAETEKNAADMSTRLSLALYTSRDRAEDNDYRRHLGLPVRDDAEVEADEDAPEELDLSDSVEL